MADPPPHTHTWHTHSQIKGTKKDDGPTECFASRAR
jgi:hypothetical protein